ncbi:hypothetical protein HanIR_Chr03g0117891 [Helianthus annuus]|uniref:uncharacterized protein LOC110931869 n=1 Tax=Helianthus annuus TaxID=4232 RepID=UPI000B8F6C74|nr:uncharacterized protein LOC110931869 [Helianthus annuus]KAJ0600530.1 hypothetical protein HanIR_Chr03g0117891 [Helianthus annuus]
MALIRRGIQIVDGLCPRCGLVDEDSEHIFISCLWTRCIWWNIFAWIRVPFPAEIHKLKNLIDFINGQPGCKIWKRVVFTIAMGTVWRVWLARNEMVFKNRFIPISKLVESIKEDVFFWIKSRSKIAMPCWEKWKTFDIIEIL